ncbi:hypothetical protein [Lysobacter capsici]|uniref:hypothetical protein n=1 Tax=Lysobacter capsici TaxID=435897 RepID=UPI001C006BA6|nr:hypothetical protein [Lysobacter capsici]QWF18359.1 hypothetical protein KME82_06240 [Lysobacter capsici]
MNTATFMNPDPITAQDPRDASQLRTLSVLYYVFSMFYLVPLMIGALYAFMGVGLLNGALPGNTATQDSASGWVLLGLAVAMFFIAILGGALTLLVARRLSQRRSLTVCIIVAAVSCMQIPFGTALGVFTLIVLNRPSVKAMFAGWT